MVGRAAIRACPKEAHQRDLLDPSLLRRFDDVPRSFNVNLLIALPADLAVDSGAVGDGVATGKSFREDGGGGKVARYESHGRAFDRYIPAVPCQQDDLMSL